MKIARDVRKDRQRRANIAANMAANNGARADLKLDLNGLDDINGANGNTTYFKKRNTNFNC